MAEEKRENEDRSGEKRRYEGQEGTDLTLKEEIETTFSNFRFSDSIY